MFKYSEFPDHPEKPVYRYYFDVNGAPVVRKYTRYETIAHQTGQDVNYRIHTGTGIVNRDLSNFDKFVHGGVYTFREDMDAFLDLAKEYYEARTVSANVALQSARDALRDIAKAKASRQNGQTKIAPSDVRTPSIPEMPSIDAANRRSALVREWLDGTPDGFRDALERDVRQLNDDLAGDPDCTDSPAYWRGYMSGCHDVLREALRETSCLAKTKKLLDGPDGMSHCAILDKLYVTARPMSHTELSEALETDSQELVTAMSSLLHSDAVHSFRTGKSTMYRLSPQGKRLARDLLACDGN